MQGIYFSSFEHTFFALLTHVGRGLIHIKCMRLFFFLLLFIIPFRYNKCKVIIFTFLQIWKFVYIAGGAVVKGIISEITFIAVLSLLDDTHFWSSA